MTDEIKIELCSPPDRQKLVAAIMINGEQFAEVNRESDSITLEIYPRQDGQPWILGFETAMSVLFRAKDRLAERSKE
jgi:hypothetical protein